MNIADLTEATKNSDRYSYEEASIEGPDGEEIKGVIVSDGKVETAIHITFGALLKLDWSALCAAAACGRDVTGYTRVTGYFAPVTSFNRGKVGELRDRAKVKIK